MDSLVPKHWSDGCMICVCYQSAVDAYDVEMSLSGGGTLQRKLDSREKNVKTSRKLLRTCTIKMHATTNSYEK